jgi:hypothetical protein
VGGDSQDTSDIKGNKGDARAKYSGREMKAMATCYNLWQPLDLAFDVRRGYILIGRGVKVSQGRAYESSSHYLRRSDRADSVYVVRFSSLYEPIRFRSFGFQLCKP